MPKNSAPKLLLLLIAAAACAAVAPESVRLESLGLDIEATAAALNRTFAGVSKAPPVEYNYCNRFPVPRSEYSPASLTSLQATIEVWT